MSEQKKYNRKRGIFIRFMVDENERDMIHERMKQSGIKSLQAFMLRLALDGHIIHVELDILASHYMAGGGSSACCLLLLHANVTIHMFTYSC